MKGEVESLRGALTEALDQQTATGEILRVIASSPADVLPVFTAVAASAARLCDAFDATIFQLDGDRLRVAAHYGPIASDPVGQGPSLARGTPSGRAVLDRRAIHMANTQAEIAEYPEGSEHARRLGFRTLLAVPLMREDLAIGVITLRRTEARLFTERQVALLQTFADQAVIAIENVRLFTELQERNRAVSEALEQQTATSEILRVISGSPTDTRPVFEGIARSGVRVCGALGCAVFVIEDDVIRVAATHGVKRERLERFRTQFPAPVSAEPEFTRVIREGLFHLADIANNPEATAEQIEYARLAGYRTRLMVPMLRGADVLGVIAVTREDASPFSDQQVELLKTFADQAVIAIENVRLFTELQASNRELTVALDTQTATSDILRVISQSQTDVQPVFDSIVHSAERLLNGHSANVLRVVGDELQLAAMTAVSEAADAETRATFPVRLTTAGVATHVIRTRRSYIATDIETDPLVGARLRHTAPLRGFRSMVMVPMVHQEQVIGVIGVTRRLPGAFSDDEVALLQTFADQAVIAIENVRLFKELEGRNRELTEALEQQTATSEILRVISNFQTDVQPVFDAIAAKALDLCRATTGWVYRFDGELIHIAAAHSLRPEAVEVIRESYPMLPSQGGGTARAVLSRAIVYIPDIREDHEYRLETLAQAADYLSVLAVPMLLEGKPIGVVVVTGAEAGAFSERQIELLQTFADQAVIAVQNVRLFTELGARTADLTRSVDQLTALGEVGRAVGSTLDLETVLTTIVSRAVELSGLDGGVVFEYDEVAEEFVQRAQTETGSALAEARRTNRIQKGEGVLGQTAITLESVQVPDITLPGAYAGRLRENLIESGIRAILAVPMVYEGRLIGCLGVTRNQPGDFPSNTIELLRTFATQSALAIQNARLFREIEDKSRQLEAASQHKSEFLANMSHELRTPLNAIIGFSEVLSERMFGELNEKQEEYLRDIYASGQHLLSLINDILDLSKIEAGRMELEVSEFHLPTALDNAMMLVRERAGRRGIALSLTVDERLGQIRGDERKIRQVVLNLLSNAIKFTAEGEQIQVRAALVDGAVEVSVSDTGVGIALEDQEAIFEEFRQVGTTAKKVEGTGLGLALSRKFVELHGGRIWVESQEGAGSTFTFTIPTRIGA